MDTLSYEHPSGSAEDVVVLPRTRNSAERCARRKSKRNYERIKFSRTSGLDKTGDFFLSRARNSCT